jgi:hypothetical protein
MRKACPYCGYPIKANAKACWIHRDLLRLDEMQTGWKPK